MRNFVKRSEAKFRMGLQGESEAITRLVLQGQDVTQTHSSQLKAAIKVNYELLDLYWTLGENIVKNQEQYSWGDAFIKYLAKDLQKEFPDMKGFSETNIKYIRRWYLFYIKGLQPVAQFEI